MKKQRALLLCLAVLAILSIPGCGGIPRAHLDEEKAAYAAIFTEYTKLLDQAVALGAKDSQGRTYTADFVSSCKDTLAAWKTTIDKVK